MTAAMSADTDAVLPVGARLRQRREAAGLSQSELARRAGIRPSTLSRWEAGKRSPLVPELEAALTALGADDAERRTMLHLLDSPQAAKRLRALEGVAAAPNGGNCSGRCDCERDGRRPRPPAPPE